MARGHITPNPFSCFSLLNTITALLPIFVTPPGLEPETAEPKSVVLPLHHGAI